MTVDTYVIRKRLDADLTFGKEWAAFYDVRDLCDEVDRLRRIVDLARHHELTGDPVAHYELRRVLGLTA